MSIAIIMPLSNALFSGLKIDIKIIHNSPLVRVMAASHYSWIQAYQNRFDL